MGIVNCHMENIDQIIIPGIIFTGAAITGVKFRPESPRLRAENAEALFGIFFHRMAYKN